MHGDAREMSKRYKECGVDWDPVVYTYVSTHYAKYEDAVALMYNTTDASGNEGEKVKGQKSVISSDDETYQRVESPDHLFSNDTFYGELCIC